MPFSSANNTICMVGQVILNASTSEAENKDKPRWKFKRNGKKYIEFRLRVRDGITDKDSFPKCWIDGQNAEYFYRYIKHGSIVSITGILKHTMVQLDLKVCPHCKEQLPSRMRDWYAIYILNLQEHFMPGGKASKAKKKKETRSGDKVVWEK